MSTTPIPSDYRGFLIYQAVQAALAAVGAEPSAPTNFCNLINNNVVQVSSAQLMAMKATPVVILPAWPPGFMMQPLFATLEFISVTAPYVTGGATAIHIGSSVNPLATNVLNPIPITLLNGSTPGNVIAVAPAANAVVEPQSFFENQSIVMTHDGSVELSGGDGTLTVKIYYMVVQL